MYKRKWKRVAVRKTTYLTKVCLFVGVKLYFRIKKYYLVIPLAIFWLTLDKLNKNWWLQILSFLFWVITLLIIINRTQKSPAAKKSPIKKTFKVKEVKPQSDKSPLKAKKSSGKAPTLNTILWFYNFFATVPLKIFTRAWVLVIKIILTQV